MVGVSQGVGGKCQSAKCNGVSQVARVVNATYLTSIKITDRPTKIEKKKQI